MKQFFVAIMVALASLALAAPASATTVEITVTCTEATFSYSQFPTNIQSSAVQTVTVDGQPAASSTVQFTGPTFVSTLPLSITGNASVTATSAWTAHRSLRPAGPRNPAKDWYTRTLGHLDPAGRPLRL